VGGALVAMAQDDAKKLLAYSSLSHLGLVMVGIFTFSPAALNGAAVQMVAHGLSVATLFLLVSYIENRSKTVGLDDFGGLITQTPLLGFLFIVSALASAALPGTMNFVGEFQILLGLYQGGGVWLAGIAGLSVILGVVYLLILIQKWFFGKARSSDTLHDLSPSEALAVVPLLLASFFFGFYPLPVASQAGTVAESLGLAAHAKAHPAAAAVSVEAAPTAAVH
jgi:NADH-quinone oxidoreductase subunit M